MNLFDIFKKSYWKTPKISREIFTEDVDLDDEINNYKTENIMDLSKTGINEIHYQYQNLNLRKELDDFLNKDFDQEGYNDALIDSDTSNMKSHSTILKLQLEKKANHAITLFENEIKQYDVDINIMTINSMNDFSDKLKVGKESDTEEITRIKTMLTEAKLDTGIGYLPILSYEQGFKRGIAAKLFL